MSDSEFFVLLNSLMDYSFGPINHSFENLTNMEKQIFKNEKTFKKFITRVRDNLK